MIGVLPNEIIEYVGSYIICMKDFISFMHCNKKINALLKREYEERLSLINTSIQCILLTTQEHKNRHIVYGLSFYINTELVGMNTLMDLSNYIGSERVACYYYKIRIYPHTLHVMKDNLLSLKNFDKNSLCTFDSYNNIYSYLKCKNKSKIITHDFFSSKTSCFLLKSNDIHLVLNKHHDMHRKFTYGKSNIKFANVKIGSSCNDAMSLVYYNNYSDNGFII